MIVRGASVSRRQEIADVHAGIGESRDLHYTITAD
jgi:hypothetical protein